MENPFEFNGFTITMLHPTQLPGVFQYIEPGLLEIQRKSKISWDIMVLPTLISANQATLAIIHREERVAGFAITQSVFLGVPSKHYLKVLAPYVELWVHQEGHDGVAAIDAYAVELARDLKCKGVLESYTRPGWGRRLEKLNYQTVEVTAMKLIEV